jgi:formylglycine-generating enzyme required for sulfatase activity
VTGGLEHPGIVPVYEIGQTATGIPYYTMRFVRGERTLADAIEEKRRAPFEARLPLLEAFLKVCDAVRYAHDNGVVHRDLKPSNVALGEYGEVVLLDWGLARLEGREDMAASAWRKKVDEMRSDARFATLEGGALGTAGYMAPEATLGRLAEVDRRSDVYGLGAMLFEILTGRLPYAFKSFAEYASLQDLTEPDAARGLDPSVPEALSALCARALSRDREARPATAQALTDAVRAWQTQDAVDREVEGLLREAEAAIASAQGLSGDARLSQVDRAAAALSQVDRRRPGQESVSRLRAQAGVLREQGARQREKAATRRTLVRTGVAAAIVLAVAGFVIAGVLDQRRIEAEVAEHKADAARADAEEATTVAKQERDAKAKALDDVLRLADAKNAHDLIVEEGSLWPVSPERAPAMAAWIGKATALVDRRGAHETSLAALRLQALPYSTDDEARDHADERRRLADARKLLADVVVERGKAEASASAKTRETLDAIQATRLKAEAETKSLEQAITERRTWRFADDTLAWKHQVLMDLLADISRVSGETNGSRGLAGLVAARHDAAASMRKRSLDDAATAWTATIAGVAASPKYHGLEIVPQLGLVPLGPDPDSTLYEFAHLGSGSVPARDPATKRLVYADDSAIVLVLLPGDTFKMGAQSRDSKLPDFDPQAKDIEGPVHSVTLSPYFLGKHEVTQAQWATMSDGLDPSRYKAGRSIGDRLLTRRDPVENVSWDDCAGNPGWLVRRGLTLPTEAQWEHACRAGSDAPWCVGANAASLSKAANVADKYCKEHGGPSDWAYAMDIDDGFTVHAPVGSLEANAFGLHDVHGNVSEWCRDTYRNYPGKAELDPVIEGTEIRIYRGGSWSASPSDVRASHRNGSAAGARSDSLGVRAARPVTSD